MGTALRVFFLWVVAGAASQVLNVVVITIVAYTAADAAHLQDRFDRLLAHMRTGIRESPDYFLSKRVSGWPAQIVYSLLFWPYGVTIVSTAVARTISEEP